MKKRSIRVRVLSCLSALLIFVGSGLSMAVPAAAATVNEQIKQLEAEQAKLKKQIAALEKKMKSEKQLNRRMEINAELKRLKKELNG